MSPVGKPASVTPSRLPAPRRHKPGENKRGANETAGHSDLHFEAAIFDMDGVITDTAAIHSTVWKRMFDEYLCIRAVSRHEAFKEFTHAHDYRAYVDGRPRYKGVETFLKSRGISLPFGSPEDLPGRETVCGLGNRKNVLFNEVIESDGISLFDSSIALIHEMLRRGVKIGLATSSNNSATILRKTGTTSLFATVVDGVASQKRGLKGKPEPDIFTVAAADLGVPSARVIVVEDAVSGVQAGVRGGFALVIGVARENNTCELRNHGADLVVTDLAETSVDEISRLVQAKRVVSG